jgi:isocitrate lyase
MAEKLYKLLREKQREGGFVATYGALDPVQVINLGKYLQAVYVSGWQCSSTASTTNDPGPDFADYPSNTVPNKVQQLFKAQLYHDTRQNEERSRISERERQQNPRNDYLAPIVADADTGFGGTTSVMKLVKQFIEAGAAGIHIEDQRVGAKKCGHMAGKVLTSAREFINKLIACRLQADICGSPLVIVARTDSLSAKLIDNNVDPIDQPFILGVWDSSNPTDLKSYPEVGVAIIHTKWHANKKEHDQKLQEWNRLVYDCSLKQAHKLAASLGFDFYFDWDTPRTSEGFYLLKGQNVHHVIQRSKEFAKYSDLVWVETDVPDLDIARQISEGIKKSHPHALLAYNLSPSFNWDAFGLTETQLKNFTIELGKLGFVFQFITLAGFHMNALASENFSREFSQHGMLAYVKEIQRQEKANNVDQLKHQKWSGTELADKMMTMASLESSVSVLSGGHESTENQFESKPPAKNDRITRQADQVVQLVTKDWNNQNFENKIINLAQSDPNSKGLSTTQASAKNQLPAKKQK